jgi:predicted nucleic acid-binding protein
MIAAIALTHDMTLATRNVRDFEGLGVRLVDPFEA